MKGLPQLRLHLAAVIEGCGSIARHSSALAQGMPRKPAEALTLAEVALIEHLATVEDALAHVRLMRCSLNAGKAA